MRPVEKFFKLKEHQTTISTELAAGLTTFLTMSYIIFVNPQILAATGMDLGAVFVATCLVSALGSFLVGVLANYPIAIAPGMALNVYFSYVVMQSEFTWQSTLGNVFISGVIFFILTISKIRYLLLRAIPEGLNIGIAIGIGIFLIILALKNTGILPTQDQHFVLGQNLLTLPIALFILGFLLILLFEYFKVFGAIVISIAAISLISILLGLSQFHGVFSWPPSIVPTLLQLNFNQVLNIQGLFNIFAFLLVVLFDSTGTFIGLLQQPGFKKNREQTRNISAALISDSLATIAGAALGTSSTSPFIESAAGIREGGRTGLTAITIAVLFLLFLFLSPLAATIPSFAVAPALLYVGLLMIKSGRWYFAAKEVTEILPSLLTVIMIPYTFSIADGLGIGLISYVLIKLLTGKQKTLPAFTYVLFFVFIIYFLLILFY